jgi:hypothetical protein
MPLSPCQALVSHPLASTTMKNVWKFVLILVLTIVVTGIGAQVQAFGKPGHQSKSAPYSLTRFHLTPRQFSKAYHAEKREYRSIKSSNFRRMMKKRHGSRLYRWFHRNF